MARVRLSSGQLTLGGDVPSVTALLAAKTLGLRDLPMPFTCGAVGRSEIRIMLPGVLRAQREGRTAKETLLHANIAVHGMKINFQGAIS